RVCGDAPRAETRRRGVHHHLRRAAREDDRSGMTSQSLFERAVKTAPGGVHSPVRAFHGVGGTPVFMASAHGSRLTDVSAVTYIDFCMSFGPLILGHHDPVVAEAVHRAVDDGWSYGTCEPYSLAL